jgi:hypothetical protein
MNKLKKDQELEYHFHKLISFIISFLPRLFKNFDWERFEVTNGNESFRSEHDFDNRPSKHGKERRQTELTFETLQQYKGFENTTETGAIKQIEGIKKLAKILFCLYQHEQQNLIA